MFNYQCQIFFKRIFKILLDDPRISSSSVHGIYSHQSTNKTHPTFISSSDIIENTSNPTSDSEHIPRSQNPYIRTLSGDSITPSSRIRSPILTSPLRTYHQPNGHLIDSAKSNSLLTSTTFNVLMNNLKTMREKDLDSIIHNNDDSLVQVTD